MRKGQKQSEEQRARNRKAQQKYAMEHPEKGQKHSKYLKKCYKDDPEAGKKNSERQKQWNIDHPEAGKKNSERQKQWNIDHPEAAKEHSKRMKKYYNDNPEALEALIKMAKENAMYGENNPAWKGGISCLPYAPIFSDSGYRDLLWARQGGVCMNPNCSEEHLDKPLVLHHIDHDKLNTWPENEIGVCVSCNTIAENKETWDYYIELYRGVTAELNNQEATEYFNNYYTNFLDFEDSSQQQLSLLEAVNQ